MRYIKALFLVLFFAFALFFHPPAPEAGLVHHILHFFPCA